MFKPLEKTKPEAQVSFTFDGNIVLAQSGISVAAALLCDGIIAVRNTPVSGSARGPFCMMGACYDCLVSVDGLTVQACQIPVADGLVVSRVVSEHAYDGVPDDVPEDVPEGVSEDEPDAVANSAGNK